MARIIRSASARIAIGLAVGQGLVYLTLPIVTRLYSAPEIGYSGVFLAVASIIAAVSTLRIELLLPNAPDDDVRYLAATALKSSVAVGGLTAIGGFAVGTDPVNSCLLGLTVGAIGAVALSLQLKARASDFVHLGTAKAVQGTTLVIAQLASGAMQLTKVGLQIGIALSFLASFLIQLMGSPGRRFPRKRPPVQTRRVYWRSSLWLTASAVFNITTVWIHILLVSLFFGSNAVGHLTIASRLVAVPVGLVVAALAPVVISRVGSAVRNGETEAQVLWLYIRRLTPLAVAMLLSLLVIPESFISSVFGQEWGAAKGFLASLAPAYSMMLIAGPLGQVLIAQGRTKTQFAWDASRFGVTAMIMTGAVSLGSGPTATVLAGSIALAIMYCVYLWLILRPPPRNLTAHRVASSPK